MRAVRSIGNNSIFPCQGIGPVYVVVYKFNIIYLSFMEQNLEVITRRSALSEMDISGFVKNLNVHIFLYFVVLLCSDKISLE